MLFLFSFCFFLHCELTEECLLSVEAAAEAAEQNTTQVRVNSNLIDGKGKQLTVNIYSPVPSDRTLAGF